MAQQTVHHCDWCNDVVNTTADGKPQFRAQIKATQTGGRAPLGTTPKVYDVCNRCFDAFTAITEGKYRR
jgi:hypothetical protein